MNRVPFLVWLFLSLFLIAFTAEKFCELFPRPTERTITVHAIAEAGATPDIALITVGLINEGKTATEAQTQSATQMQQIYAFITSQGIDKADVRTVQFQLEPVMFYAENKPPQITGFRVNQSLMVKVRKLDTLGPLIAGAVGAGANSVSSPQFVVDNPEAVTAEARTSAFAKAKKLAQDQATAAGVTLGSVVTFNEDLSSPSPSPRFQRAMMEKADVAPPMPAGTQNIQVGVNITYIIR